MFYKFLFVSLSVVIIFLAGGQLVQQESHHLAPTSAQAAEQQIDFFQEKPAPVALQEPIPTPDAVQPNSAPDLAANHGQQDWFIRDENSNWTESELEIVSQVLDETIQALSQAGLDGQEILQGYRFRRFQGEFVDSVDGRLAIVDHQKDEIVLSDAAFKRHQGFNIYHEIGHIVDYRLERQLSQNFHLRAGTNQVAEDGATAEGYWLRDHGRYDREEATADGFALWVLAQNSEAYRPVFFGTPLAVDYEGIIGAIAAAIQEASSTAGT